MTATAHVPQRPGGRVVVAIVVVVVVVAAIVVVVVIAIAIAVIGGVVDRGPSFR